MDANIVDKTALDAIFEGPAVSLDDTAPCSVKATLVADTKCILGECVLFNDEQNSILWTDIDGKRLYTLKLDTGDVTFIKFPKMLGAFCLTNNPDILLCGWQDGFQLYSLSAKKAVSEYSKGPLVNPDGLPSRLNDGRCDPTGNRFICGGFFGGNKHSVRVKVYSCRLDNDKTLVHEAIMENVKITNSLCFSPDGDTMYFCDSPTKTIQQYDYNNKNGKPVWKRNVWTWNQEQLGFPDGSCVDEEGYIWNALWREGAGPGRIHRIHPATGNVDLVIHMPDTTSQCTCVCFGGKDLNVLFITTASIDRNASLEPQAGGLYAVKVPFRGRLESRFQLPATFSDSLDE